MTVWHVVYKPVEFVAYHWKGQPIEDFPPWLVSKISTLSRNRLIVNHFERRVPVKIKSWIILKGNLLEIKSPASFHNYYEIIDETTEHPKPAIKKIRRRKVKSHDTPKT